LSKNKPRVLIKLFLQKCVTSHLNHGRPVGHLGTTNWATDNCAPPTGRQGQLAPIKPFAVLICLVIPCLILQQIKRFV